MQWLRREKFPGIEANERRIELPLRHALDLLPREDLPLLRMATFEPTYGTKIVWGIGGEVEWNSTQIFRQPFRYSRPCYDSEYEKERSDDRRKNCILMLRQIETALWHGIRQQWGSAPAWQPGWCGGFEHIMGRWPRVGDRIVVRHLRDLTLRSLIDFELPDEYLVEISAEYHSGERWQNMPLIQPPRWMSPLTATAYEEGSGQREALRA